MNIIYRKVWRDLAHNKTRTFLAVLSTAVGIFALGTVFGMSGVMRTRMTEDNLASVPAHISFFMFNSFQEDALESIRHEKGVAGAEAATTAAIRWKLEGEKEWRNGDLTVRQDYADQRMNLLDLVRGHWPEENELAVERQSSLHFNLPVGTVVIVDTGRRELRLPVSGVVRDPQVYPPQFGGNAAFLTTQATLPRLTDLEDFNIIHVRMDTFDEEEAEALATRIEERLNRMDIEVGGYATSDPSEHFAQDIIDSIFLIMGVMGALSLALGAFLIINTMNALISQQVWQIGVMKAVGATLWGVVRVYLATALIYGGLAFCLAVPLSGLAAYLVAQWMLGLFNITMRGYPISLAAIGLEAAAGFGVPLLAALVPVIGGARISVHAAISSYGLGHGFGKSVVDRLIGRIRRLPRPLALSLRNTFRRKSRVALTLLTLILSGLLFIMVMSVGDSLRYTIEMLISDFGLDVLIVLEQPYRTPMLEEATLSVPGVTRVEVWNIVVGAAVKSRNGEDLSGQLWGVPDNSQIFNPRIVAGRGLLPDDDHAILLNQKIGADESIEVGDTVTLTIQGNESHWTVVGQVINLNNNQHDNFVPADTLAREIGQPHQGNMLMLLADAHDVSGASALINRLRDTYRASKIKALAFQSAMELRQQTSAQFNIIVGLLLAMAVLAAVIGSLGLASTMSINVIERGREIGVMRSIGAKSSAIAGIFVLEGVLLGMLSWLAALPLSYPVSFMLTRIIGETMLGDAPDFSYSVTGALLWLAIIVLLSALASLWPSWRATRISVREALAYE